MDLWVAFMGTGASVPTARRSTAAVVVGRGGDRMLFDCGEGTQRQLQRSLGLIHLDEIFLTHLHADHFLGLPGLLKTYDLGDRSVPLTIYGPAGLRELFGTLRRVMGRTRYEINLVELRPNDVVGKSGYVVKAFSVSHGTTTALGYELAEEDRPGRFDPEAAIALGVRPGPDFKRLQDGEPVIGESGDPVPADKVLGPARSGRSVVITGDTSPCSATVAAAADAELLIHDSSFAEEDVDRAAETGHSTARQAGAVAAEAHVKMLALVHISARYHVGSILEEARGEFPEALAPRDFDLIEIPFPERGPPELIQNGARERGESAKSAVPAADA